jgi:threonine/homoserine/homoserine lactone efflux protein
LIIPPTIVYFLPTALFVLLLPGPAVFYVTARSLAEGRRSGLASVAGVQLADLTHAVLATVGLSTILYASAIAFDLVKFLGAGYLVYLGLRIILSKDPDEERKEELRVGHSPHKLARVLANGFLVDMLNPKTALFFYAFLPQFVDPRLGAATQQILLFGVTFVLLGICTDSSYALLGASVGRYLTKTKLIRSGGRYLRGGVYIVLGLVAATASRSNG